MKGIVIFGLPPFAAFVRACTRAGVENCAHSAIFVMRGVNDGRAAARDRDEVPERFLHICLSPDLW